MSTPIAAELPECLLVTEDATARFLSGEVSMSKFMPRLAAFVAFLLACGTTFEETRRDSNPATRLTASTETRIVIQPRPDHSSVVVSEESFLDFMRWTLPRTPTTEGEVRAIILEDWRAVLPRPQRSFHLVQASLGSDPLVDAYHAWCAGRSLTDDCSGALRGKSYIDAQGRYRIAFDIALGAEWAGFVNEMQGLVDPTNVKVMLLGAMVLYMATIAVPELVTKFVAAAITVVVTAYLGAQTVWELVFGWLEMVRAADAATTFSELQAAGNRYGNRVGAQFTRILVMVVTAAIAEGGLVARALKLPKAPVVATTLAKDSSGKLSLGGLGQVSGASVAESGVTVVVRPAELVHQAVGTAMAARGTAGPSAQSNKDCDDKPEDHHIATVENSKSVLRGGPWTPVFERLFARAGMTLKNAANVVSVKGHRGPHPQEYHEAVFGALERALGSCRSTEVCRERLVTALRELAKEISTPGSDLNKLVTRGCPD